jgi:hypothetical protein
MLGFVAKEGMNVLLLAKAAFCFWMRKAFLMRALKLSEL